MNSFDVVVHNGILVIDSRLIALELGIQHKNFLTTLNKYLSEIEEDWGQVALETETVTNSVGASNSAKYALLTEQQATLLMTYSRNTDQVRQCKRRLVKAFELAKLALSVTLELRVKSLEQELAETIDAIATLQSQIGNLLPPDNNFAPPGWDAETWRQLPPQDKRHFRFLARRRRFRPDNQTTEPLALPQSTVEEMKQQQCLEVERLVGEVSDEEKARVEAAKQEMLARFWAEG